MIAHAPPSVPWRPAPALVATAGLHAAGFATLAFMPASWPAVAAALVVNHAVLAGAGLVPRSRLLGPNLTRLPAAAADRGEVALTFDDGPDPEVTPRVLDLLDAHGARATFFCVGERATRHAALASEIVARGHALENHTQHHSTAFGWYGPRRLREEIVAAQRALTPLTGQPPRYFRAPFGMRSPLLDPVLAKLGLALVSWTRRGFDTRDADAARVLGRLLRGLTAGDILLLHDGIATGRPRAAPTTLAVLPALLACVRDAGLRAVTLPEACDA